MNEERGATATLPPPPPAPESAPKPKRTWREAFDLLRANPGTMMLPVLVTQVPSGLILGGIYFYLHHFPYSDAEVSLGGLVSNDSPSALLFWMIVATAVHSLLSFIGGAASVVAANGVLHGKPPSLSEALDPPFTRMGGVLLLAVIFNITFAATTAGVVVLAYFLIRFGLGFHAFILDGASPFGALGRSWRMLGGRMLRFLGLLVSTIPVILGILFVFLVVLIIVTAPIGPDPGRDATVTLNAIALGGAAFFSAPITAYLAAATTMFYLSAKEQSRA